MPKPFVYGHSPNPTNWKEAAAAMKSQPRKHGSKDLWKRLDAIEELLKGKK